ncbi:MAG: DUF962 domain-containing protein [Polyangiales bacterium]
MTAPRITSFEDFWPHYVAAHRKPLNRAFHYAGTTAALGCVATGVATLNPLWFLAAPVVGYGPAWFGHFVIEGNRPATFGYARYSLMGDFKMLGLALRGRMGDEVTRLLGSPNPGPDARLLEPAG